MDLSKDVKFEVTCPHCKCVKVHAVDVDLSSSVKRYSDSPYGTLRQSLNKQGNKWVPMSIVNEVNIEESQAIPDNFEVPGSAADPNLMNMTK